MLAPNSAPSRFSAAFAAAVRFAVRLRDAGENRRAVRGLASLDDRLLRDIGLTRFDVDAALIEPALADGTLILAERAREQRQHQRAQAREAQSWAGLTPATAKRAA